MDQNEQVDGDGVVWRVVPYGASASIRELRGLKRRGLLMAATGYWASSDGEIRKGTTEKAVGVCTNGYYSTAVNGKNRFIHRIVCWAFHGEPPKLDMWVNHRNGNKSDNRPDNLEWTTIAENIQHAWDTGLCDTESHRQSALRISKRVVVERDGQSVEHPSLAAAAAALGVKGPNLHDAIRTGRTIKGAGIRYADGVTMERHPPANIDEDGRARRVARLDENGEIAEVFAGIEIAARSVGKSRKTIWSALVSGGTCGGSRWKRVARSVPLGRPGKILAP